MIWRKPAETWPLHELIALPSLYGGELNVEVFLLVGPLQKGSAVEAGCLCVSQ